MTVRSNLTDYYTVMLVWKTNNMVGQAWPRHGVFLGVPRKYLCHDLLFPSHSISLLLCNLPLLCTFFFRQAEIHFKTHMQLGFNKYTILKNKHVKNKTNKQKNTRKNVLLFWEKDDTKNMYIYSHQGKANGVLSLDHVLIPPSQLSL